MTMIIVNDDPSVDRLDLLEGHVEGVKFTCNHRDAK